MLAAQVGDLGAVRLELLASPGGEEARAWRFGMEPDLQLEDLHLHRECAEEAEEGRLATLAARGPFSFARKAPQDGALQELDAATLKALVRLDKGQTALALERLRKLGEGAAPDLGFLLAVAQMQTGDLQGALDSLESLQARGLAEQLGQWLQAQGLQARLFVPCERGEIRGMPGPHSHALLAARCCEQLGREEDSLAWWELAADRSDWERDRAPLLLLGYVECALRLDNHGENGWLLAQKATDGLRKNLTQSHAELLLLRGQALHYLDMLPEALRTLTLVAGRTAKRRVETILEARYDRALLYLRLNRRHRAREEWKAILRVRKDYMDVFPMLLDQMGDMAGKTAWARKQRPAPQATEEHLRIA